MKILLANPRGFCAGVEMAVDCVDEALTLLGAPLYVYHEIVHNKFVVERFTQRGVVFVEDIAEVPENQTVIFSAHGVSPTVRQESEARGLRMIDATCPLVTKVHMEAIRYARQGYQILLVGHRNHQEIKGTFGQAPDVTTVVESPEEVAQLPFTQDDKLVYLTQTTLSVDEAEHVIGAIMQRYPKVKAPPNGDICYATTNRQQAVRQLASQVDITIVVGSKNSSNSNRLAELSDTQGAPGYLVDSKDDLDDAWFTNVKTVLMTAGASAPEDLVQGIIEALKDRYQATVELANIAEEKMSFALPVQLRVLQKEAEA